MTAYRFCRTDDIALLTGAVNACCVAASPGREPLSTDDFKREIRELGVWCSSCMVASADGDPIGVVTGAKRERETLVHRLGVLPGFQRRGHARHLLESLGRKLSVLGPPRVVAELPQDRPAVRELFEALGYREEQRFADFALPRPLAPVRATGAVHPVGLDDLLRYEAFDPSVPRSWERALPTLQNRKDQIRGLAIASDTRVEAYALFRDLPAQGRREIVAVGGAAPGRESGAADARALVEIAIRVACQVGSLAVSVPRVANEEISWARLESMGFQKGQTYLRYAGSFGAE